MAILDELNQTLFPGHRVIRVNGWQAAEKYPLPRDCETIMLDLDPNSDYVYMKKVDLNGGETFQRYQLIEDPVPVFDPEKYATVNDFKALREEMLNGFNSIKQSIANANSSKSSGNNK